MTEEKTWAEIVQPLADKLVLPAIMGMGVNLNAENAKHVGQTIERMAKALDNRDRERWLYRKLLREVTKGLAFFVVLVVAGYFFN